MNEIRIMRAAVVVMAAMIVLMLGGCENGANQYAGTESSSSDVQKYPVGSYERRMADNAALGIEEHAGEVTDFGSGSIFEGIEIESDENGEVICTQRDGALWYKITDKRFGSYSALTGFVRKKTGAGEMGALRLLFMQGEDGLYFTVGAKEHNVKDTRRYYFDDASRLTVIVTHQPAPGQRYRAVRSEIHFTREDGVWKLDRLTVISA